MKKLFVLGFGLCLVMAFTSCKSSESAYKKAYEKAKQNELAEAANNQEAVVETAPVVEAAPVVQTPAPVSPAPVREEKVELVSGDGLKAFSVVCGSFGVKANADGLKSTLDGQGYNAKVVYNAERNMYRVIVASFDTREEAAAARDAFKAKYPNRQDFQGSWLLYRVY
ncbi:SPOR domain-containing protein [Bacteroides caecigallinarum]|uniref:SPOR domain-containing protein n=1 Tax=Candidatus Phocaeicola faecigallinarum TaxID=2838732 RepID=A0A948TC93_9BACT|nr:SPOR domain-containing protein [Bacteroides caecigallinarum]MBM6882527.1 SPOR domain-containing protein [Bacteroides caecigallinarum]MBM6888950.1 SPOR domain-containing protein [Bacteroides caecigallinarum]MBU3838338.1 SPOR domain-containing protein [Candidatus Phocaeicola faecigallinarum]MCF2550611.1 SPOR domain-containing protein [Bacteroides caecigallinarum]